MPKETFHKLPAEKKKKLIDAFLREFSVKRYDDASITAVVRSLGIAKGSIYQYFKDKLDLFLFLKEECGAIKVQYISHIKREDYPDFWDYFRALYKAGLRFDLERPLESNFLHSLAEHINAPSMKIYYADWLEQVMQAMCYWIQYEVDRGHFRDDVPVKSMAFFLYQVTTHIGDYMRALHGLNIDSRLNEGQPVYGDKNGEILLQSVEEYISILKRAFEKPNP